MERNDHTFLRQSTHYPGTIPEPFNAEMEFRFITLLTWPSTLTVDRDAFEWLDWHAASLWRFLIPLLVKIEENVCLARSMQNEDMLEWCAHNTPMNGPGLNVCWRARNIGQLERENDDGTALIFHRNSLYVQTLPFSGVSLTGGRQICAKIKNLRTGL